MKYKNQLALTGKINDVGAYTRNNIDDSYRKGIEIEAKYNITPKTVINSNITISENKINNYTEYIDNWDSWVQESVDYKNTDLAFSPNTIWSSILSHKLTKNTDIDIISKYVGEQFIDNTSSEERMLEAYLVNHLRISYNWNNRIFKKTRVTLQINNILDNKYVSNAWVYRFISEGWDPRDSDPYVNTDREGGYNMAGYFPEATRNYMLDITLTF